MLQLATTMPSLTQVLLLPPLLVVLHLLHQYLGRLRPLNAIPNAHPTAAFSPLWLLWVRYRKRENRTVWESHQRLGPVVRLAPKEVSVCTLQGVKTIYGDWGKNEWYAAFYNYGTPPLVAELDASPHFLHKRRMGNIYSKSFLQNSADISKFNTQILTEKVLPQIAAAATTGSPIDVLSLGYAYGMDVMSAYLLGSTYGTNYLSDGAALTRFLASFADVKTGLFWAGRVPSLTRILQRIGLNPISQVAIAGQAYLEATCWELCSRVHTAIESNTVDPDSTAPVVYAQLHTSISRTLEKTSPSPTDGPDFLRRSVASDMVDQLLAGYETSGIATTYAMYELSLHPTCQSALRAELRALSPSLIFPPESSNSAFSPSSSSPPSTLFRALDALPLLNAVLYETLRLYPPGPAGQARVVPRGGATLCGFTLPEGVVAHVSPYSLHRNEEVYESAETWVPERWLGNKKKIVGEWFWAFGSGSRGCIGKAFAIQEMLVFLAAIYANYSTHIVEVGDMRPEDGFMGGPVGEKVILRFEKA